jgi:tetratricopeptide (TPR) repeat protein
MRASFSVVLARALSILLTAMVALLLFGCSPAVSIRPLYTQADLEKPINDPRIEGKWSSFDPDKADSLEKPWMRATFEPPKEPSKAGSTYSVEIRFEPDPGKGDEISSYDFQLVAIGDKLFFDATLSEQTEGQVKISPEDFFALVPAHLIGRIWVRSDYLRLSFLDSGWIEKNSPANFQEFVGRGKGDDLAIITGSTQEVRNFLFRNSDGEKAMDYILYLCRPGADCGPHIFDDELSKLPKDQEMRSNLLQQAGNFYLVRGNYDRAVEIRRSASEFEPKDVLVRAALCRALLFKRDFAAARTELGAAQKLAREESSSAAVGERDFFEGAAAEAAEAIVWSYFIEGDYSGAVTAAEYYKAPDGYVSANPILLSYFSLLRLGKRTEAEALLKEQSRQFRGPQEDQLLLLDEQGRLIDRVGESPVSLKGDALRRFDFYRALQWIEDGNPEYARRYLQSALSVSDAPIDGPPALAAKIELDRLGPSPRN